MWDSAHTQNKHLSNLPIQFIYSGVSQFKLSFAPTKILVQFQIAGSIIHKWKRQWFNAISNRYKRPNQSVQGGLEPQIG